VDEFHTNSVVRFPCAATTKLLVEAGAEVGAMDEDRNTRKCPSSMYILTLLQKGVYSKQWLLAREFSEFEYSHSPKWLFFEICKTRQTRQHLPSNFGILAKLAFAKNKIS
jgi:hypothetical protein